MENVETLRAQYRTLRAACIARTGQTAAAFDADARYIGTQDGEGEPATARDYVQGALEIAYDLGIR